MSKERTKEEQEMHDATDEALEGKEADPISDQEHTALIEKEQSVQTQAEDDAQEEMEGFEDVPDSEIMRPSFVRVVQPMSKDIEIAGGAEAGLGEFYFNDLRYSSETIEICYLRGKSVQVNFPKKDAETGQMKDDWKKQIKILAICLDPKCLIILTLSVTSFSNFGKFKSDLKKLKAKAGYEYKVLLSTHKEENDQGKFWVTDFEVGEKNSPSDLHEFGKFFEDYKNALEQRDDKNPDGMPF